MKFALLLSFFAALLMAALAAPAPPAAPATLLRYVNNNNGAEGYSFAFETSDGTSRQEKSDNKVVSGSYSYKGPDGVVYTVNYTADENGFRPSGSHIPLLPSAAPVSGNIASTGSPTLKLQSGQSPGANTGKSSTNQNAPKSLLGRPFRSKRQEVDILNALLKARLF